MEARWEGKALLQPIAADQPCGENLEDTQLLASFDAFRLFGQSVALDPPPNWGEIRNKALEALGTSKDLRLLAHLGTALLRTDGLPAFAETLTIASQWLETYWVGTYPLVDEDAILRRSALNCFADQMAVIDALRRTPLVRSRQHGTFSLRDIEIAGGVLQPGANESRPDEGRINAAFAELSTEDLKTLHESVSGAVAAIQRIDGTMGTQAGIEAVPGLEPLSGQLTRVEKVLRGHLAARGQVSAEDAGAGDTAEESGGQTVAVGAIKSRQDAIRALDAVAEYFRRNEPSSPIPLFIERAKRLVAKDFLEVLADIAPDAIAQARSAGGLPPGE